jgi:hypothetical protein
MALVVITPFICAQNSRTAVNLSQGINLLVTPLNDFSRALGLRDDEVENAARMGIESNRWRMNNSSNLVISLNVVALPQRDEDLYPFRIEVHGGMSHEVTAGKEFSPDVVGDIPAVKTISIPWADDSKILATVEELSSTVSGKLRREVIRRQYRK